MAKKNFTLLTHRERKSLIDKEDSRLTIARQAELLNVSRANVYYIPKIDPEELKTLNALDQAYTKHPFYGSRRLRFALRDDYDIFICRERTQRLMRILGIQAIYPKRNTSAPAPGHRIYPYLLRKLPILRPNQVWSTDITYIQLEQGFCYLTVILDWFSRYVLAWELSKTMETEFCARALTSALATAVPEIHNSDQGAQFTSLEYTNILETNKIKISMDGRGRCLDNIFTERLWRSVKYEDIYLKHYRTIEETFAGLENYFPFYNNERRQQGLEYRTPKEIYLG